MFSSKLKNTFVRKERLFGKNIIHVMNRKKMIIMVNVIEEPINATKKTVKYAKKSRMLLALFSRRKLSQYL